MVGSLGDAHVAHQFQAILPGPTQLPVPLELLDLFPGQGPGRGGRGAFVDRFLRARSIIRARAAALASGQSARSAVGVAGRNVVVTA